MLVMGLTLVLSITAYAGCGNEKLGNCVISFAHYTQGTGTPCTGSCGGCVYTFCGPTIEPEY